MSIFLKANWQNLIMANYAVPSHLLQPYLPAGVSLDEKDGTAWVSLVGFMFKNTKIFNIPIPLLGSFEEINLRFYVKRQEANGYKRGVVFINESVPYKLVAWMANKLYKEHYTVLKTKHSWQQAANNEIHVAYSWLLKNVWQSIAVKADNTLLSMEPNSFEAFIFEHYFGYAKVNDVLTEEYKINHPSWLVHEVKEAHINCDFAQMYGAEFGFLSNTKPNNVFIASGSAISVDWKRKLIKI